MNFSTASMKDAVKAIFTEEIFGGYVNIMTLKVILICESIAGILLLIAVVYNIATSTWKSKGVRPIDINEISRIVVLMFVISLYIPLMTLPITVIHLTDKMTRPSLEQWVEMSEQLGENAYENGMLSGVAKQMNKKQGESGEVQTKQGLNFWDMLGNLTTSTAFLAQVTLDAIFAVILNVLGFAMRLLVIQLAKVFYIIGPFAITASILPIWRDKLAVWFNTFVTIGFTAILMNILDTIVYGNLSSDFVNGIMLNNSPSKFYNTIAFNISMVVLYTLSFWISGKVVGSSDAGKFLSQTWQIATTAMSGKIGGMGKFGKMMGGKGMSAGKDAMSLKP